jgi:hypothetical protein
MKWSVLFGVSGIVCIVVMGISCTPQPTESSENPEMDSFLTFSTTPEPFTTHTGATDTLVFTLDNFNEVAYTLSCSPVLDSTELHFAASTDSGTTRVHFDPDQPDNYTVTLSAEVGKHSAEATVDITVLPSFTPLALEHPDTLATGGNPDTLIYILSPDQIALGIDMGVTVDENLICGTIAVIPVGTDSLLIIVNSVYAGPIIFSVVTTNEAFSDTITRTLMFIDEVSAVWSSESFAAEATAGITRTHLKSPSGAAVSLPFWQRKVSRNFVTASIVPLCCKPRVSLSASIGEILLFRLV